MKLCKDKDLTYHVHHSIFITKVETPHRFSEWSSGNEKNCFLRRRAQSIDQLLSNIVATSHTALICTCDFILTRYGKMTDKETTALKEKFTVCIPKSSYTMSQSHTGSTKFGQEEGKRKTPTQILCFPWKRWRNNFHGLWTIGVVPSCLVPSPRWLGQEKYWCATWERFKGGGWFAYEKCVHRAGCSLSLRISWEGAGSSWPSWCQSIIKYRKFKNMIKTHIKL